MPASQRRPASRRRASRWRRPAAWAAWIVGLAIAVALGWFVFGSVGTRGGPPLDDIDAASRRQLESLLREEQRGSEAP